MRLLYLTKAAIQFGVNDNIRNVSSESSHDVGSEDSVGGLTRGSWSRPRCSPAPGKEGHDAHDNDECHPSRVVRACGARQLVLVREVLAVPDYSPEAGSRCPAGTQSRWQGPVKRTTASINQLHLARGRNMDAAKESHQPTLK